MPVEIFDLHSRDCNVDTMQKQILDGLSLPAGQKEMPTMLLYDQQGLRLYDDITTEAKEYYLFGAEEEILKMKANEIVDSMHHGAGLHSDEVILELGAGALRKTSHILLGLSHLVGKSDLSASITYYALDLEQQELERTLSIISNSELGSELANKVLTKGLCGTYDDGLKFIQKGGLINHKIANDLESVERHTFTRRDSSLSSNSGNSDLTMISNSNSSLLVTPVDANYPPLHIMFLGSSLGNFSRADAASFLRSLPLRAGSGDTLLIGLDHDNEKGLIEEAYNDKKGYTKRFIFNGLKAAGRALGDENLFDQDKWEYVNIYNEAERRHMAFFQSKCLQTIHDPVTAKKIIFLEDEMLKIEESFKFSEADAYALFANAKLRPVQRWTDTKLQYSLWLLEHPPFVFPLLLSPSPIDRRQVVNKYSDTPFGVPSREEWKDLWKSWDFITRQMIPTSMLFERPIDLRHICLFYLGHIPTFLDIHLSRILVEPNTEPLPFRDIFERGIDPDVDDPSECHPHSEVPVNEEDWPSQSSILNFQSLVRSRLMKLYDGIDSGNIKLTRKLGRVLFMTLEHEAMHTETLLYMLLQRAGTGTLPPPGFMAPPWLSLSASWKEIPAPVSKTVTLGPANVSLGHDDIESEDDNIDGLETHKFGWDNESPKREVCVNEFKIEWRPVTNGAFFEYYLKSNKCDVEFPVSWVNEDGDVKVRTMYGPVSMDIAWEWPIIASYDSLSTYAIVKGGRLPTEPELSLFYKKFNAGYEGGANVGFRNWHPVPATAGWERNEGKGGNGGVWEWTSTVFDKFEGFVSSKLYPGYSMDFFDGKHQVVLGGSYATIPRIAERRTFRNWYQHNYPYSFSGARIVYEIHA